jgi:glutamate racemase
MLGIIDWGIGGIGIYKLVKEQMPGTGVLYFSDTGATPYGKMERRELAGRLDAVINLLKEKGMSRLIIGCNAASTAIPDMRDHGIPITGVIAPAVEMTARLRPEKLGVIGGRRTILSGVYRRAFRERGIDVEQRIAQPLSALIESGDLSSSDLHEEAKLILAPIRNCSHILLACTHYPAIQPVLQNYISSQTKFIDPAAAVVKKLRSIKGLTGMDDRFFTSGYPKQMKRSGKLAFGIDVGVVKKVII